MLATTFTQEERKNCSKKYIIPWNQINIHSNKPIKRFYPGLRRKFGCSQGEIVLYITEKPFGFCATSLDCESFSKSGLLLLSGEPSKPFALSNDQSIAVGFVQERLTKYSEQMMEQYPTYQRTYEMTPSDPRKTTMKIYHIEKDELVYKNLTTLGGPYMLVYYCAFSPSNNLMALIYSKDDPFVFQCIIFKFDPSGNCEPFRTFKSDAFGKMYYTTFNSSEDLYLVKLDRDENTGILIVYDLTRMKTITVHYDEDVFVLQADLISTPKQDLIFTCYSDFNVKAYEIDRESSTTKLIIDWDVKTDLDIQIECGAFKVHYFTKIRVYLSTDEKLYVLCPFQKVILQSFDVNMENIIDRVSQEIILNWSGEEIFLSTLDSCHTLFMAQAEVSVYFFCEEKEKHNSLFTFAKRAVHANYTMNQLKTFNLPLILRSMLGLMG